MKNILIIDAQGGGLGKQLISTIKQNINNVEIMAVGTNSVATSNMLKAGADHAATGENSIVVCSKKADIIVGPIGIVIADSLYGEITKTMAVAIGQSNATKVLIPFNSCDNIIIGIKDSNMTSLVNEAILKIKQIVENN